MARLQILELPEGADDDRPPFVLIVDEYEPQRYILGPDQPEPEPVDEWECVTPKIGARAVLVFQETIDIPANEITLSDATDGNVVRLRVEPDLTGFTDTVMAEALSAQAKAAEAIGRNQDDRKAAITDALGIDRTRDWDAIRDTAAELRQERDSRADAIDRVRRLHRPVTHQGQVICWECSAYDFAGLSTDNAPVGYDQCRTNQALNAPEVP